MNKKLNPILLAILCACAGPALAQSPAPVPAPDPLRAAVQKAIAANPEVTARINALRAAASGIDIARGPLLPRVDLEARVAQDRDRITSRTPESARLSHTGVALSVNQTIWDGLLTRNDVRRAEHEKMARHFELEDVTQQTALEAVRAYYDVLRYRELIALAEDNYVQHKYVFSQIESRFRAGVGRGVDLEQANARLALAESNLTTELANLHDVSARYQRIVGELPPPALTMPAGLAAGVPATAGEAMEGALARNPAVSATVESLRATRAVVSARESLFQPKVDARVRSGAGHNFDAITDQHRDTRAEIVLNWNLFNGGADRARVRQQADLVNQAADLRDKACRDARQTASIAFNDTKKLAEQLVYLERNTLAIEKARDAYRQQFDIGQRSLLDLLNAENEVYTARRAYANAQYDQGIAYARTHASMQQLLARLGLSAADTGVDTPEAADWASGEDAPTRCPAEVQVMAAVPRAELDRQARRLIQTAPQVAPAAAPAPAAEPPASTMHPVERAIGDVTQRVREWAAAWSAKDADRYLAFYDGAYAPPGASHETWVAQRRQRLGKRGSIEVRIEGLKASAIGPNTVEVSFEQAYTSIDYRDRVAKTQEWRRVGGQWVIVSERAR
jgi:adhesin transport system outer membrane protein